MAQGPRTLQSGRGECFAPGLRWRPSINVDNTVAQMEHVCLVLLTNTKYNFNIELVEFFCIISF